MIEVRKANERGHAEHGWLESYHTFSFAGYFDQKYMGFRSLRVINEDRVQPARGFGIHPHQDMEIFSYVLEGTMQHQDSMGNGSVIRAGEIQRMSAGTGILHSEFNALDSEPVHFYQIWITPEKMGLKPEYEQKAFAEKDRINRFQPVLSSDGRQGSLVIHQDAVVSLATLEAAASVEYPLVAGRSAWVQVVRGEVDVNGVTLMTSDGAAISEQPGLQFSTQSGAEIMLFDLA